MCRYYTICLVFVNKLFSFLLQFLNRRNRGVFYGVFEVAGLG